MALSVSKFFSREGLLVILPAVLVTGLAFWVAAQFIKPAPPSEITIATGSVDGAYHRFAALYARYLADAGIKLNVKATAGSGENIRHLVTEGSHVELALIQGGISGREPTDSLVSLGRMFLEPVWVFYRGAEQLDRLSALKGKTIAIGPDGSGTRKLALALFKPNDVTTRNTNFTIAGGVDAAQELISGKVDAVFLVAAPEAEAVQRLSKAASVQLMSLRQAEAMTRKFPFLTKVNLPEGVVDFVSNVPDEDKTMVAAEAALVAKSDIHPALVGLLVNAAKRVHREGGLFQNIGEYPKAQDPEYPMSDAAEIAYNSGVPFLQRFLPFWLANFIERMFILLVPVATIVFPLVKLGPWLYEWRVRRRLLYWYGELKDLEHQIAQNPKDADLTDERREIERISNAVSVIPVPLSFSDRFYELRAAVDLVEQRLNANK